MSDSRRLSYLINDAYSNDDAKSCFDVYNEWQSSNCYFPVRQQIYDSHQQIYRTILLPCGKCYHCMESKINEWVTRMYAHADDFKHVYFITLTYRSFVDLQAASSKLVLKKLSQAVWHRDALNANHHMSYNPCLLIKKHYQDFFKRLRKYTGIKDLSYVVSGEYGSKYGRPHFHAILFSSSPISKEDIVRAWSVCLWRSNSGDWSYKTNQRNNGTSYFFPFGRVDFNDLVSNGTFNTSAKVRVDDTYMSASRCFSYVVKYVCKRDSSNLKRVSLAYHSLYTKSRFVRIYDNEIPANTAAAYCRDHGIDYTSESLYYFKTKFSYEKIIPKISERVFSDSLCLVRTKTLFGHSFSSDYFPKEFIEFRDLFAPFVEFSRGTPIGSVYAKNHLSEFTQGVFNKPILQDTSFVVPSYFRNKAKVSVYGLRKMRKTIKSISYNFGDLLELHRFFSSFGNSDVPFSFVVPGVISSQDRQKLLFDDRYVFKDCSNNEKMIVFKDHVEHFKFNRSSRSYSLTRSLSIPEWIRFWSARLLEEYKSYYDSLNRSKDNLRNLDRAFCMLTDLGYDTSQLRQDFNNKQQEFLSNRQKLYDDVHKSVE